MFDTNSNVCISFRMFGNKLRNVKEWQKITSNSEVEKTLDHAIANKPCKTNKSTNHHIE